jgi:hypothetical protein
MKNSGKLPLSQFLPMLKQIAYEHELKINRVKDLRIALFILKCRGFSTC